MSESREAQSELVPRPRLRPRDRKDQILSAAGRMFATQGFRNVTMTQISESVGITAGALYRHFVGKSALLEEVLTELVVRFDTVGASAASFEELLDGWIRAAPEISVFGTLWSRESRHLTDEGRKELGARLRRDVSYCAELIGAERSDITRADAEMLAWAVFSIIGSVSSVPRELSTAQQGRLLGAVCREVKMLRLPTEPKTESTAGLDLSPVSKREKIILASGQLFGALGYEATTMAEIGAASDVTGPSLYTHFRNKAEILDAVCERVRHTLWIDVHTAFKVANDAEGVLRRIVESYVMLVRDQPGIISILVTDSKLLPTGSHDRQVDYVSEWVALVQVVRPTATRAQAFVLVMAAINTINNFCLTASRISRSDLTASVTAIATAILIAEV